MKQILLVTALFLVFIGNSQETKNTTFTKNELIKAAVEIMNSTGTCALITQDENGISRARTMDPFPPEKDMIVVRLGRKYGNLLDDMHHKDFYQFIDAALEMYN
jgi:hypothetical protein